MTVVHRHRSLRSASTALCVALALVALGVGSAPALAQFADRPACATAPDDHRPNVRILGATCGSATFPVGAAERRQRELTVETADALYIRTVVLRYATAGGTVQEVAVPMHRLLEAGEATDPFPTTHAGRGLISVTIDVSPPGYGHDGIGVALTAPGGESAQTSPAGAPAEAASVASMSDYKMIGSSVAHVQQLRDTITIGRQKGRFDSLMLSSRGNDLPVQSITVVPVNGPPFAADIHAVIAPGRLSSAVAVDPPDFLHEVIVTYGTIAAQSRTPTVEIRGRYSENWLGKIGENRQYAGGWVMLGTADIVVTPHKPHARFQVGGQAGPFHKLRFVARRGAVDLATVTVDAGDGRQETVPVNTMLLPDIQSAPVSWSAGSMPLGTVTLAPRLNANSRLDASVEVWAQY